MAAAAAGHTIDVMPDSSPYAYSTPYAETRAISTAQLLGQVMFLVSVALGFMVLGTFIGRDLSIGAARACSFGGFGMLLVAAFAGERFRVGAFAMGWLFAIALLIGLGLGPVIEYFASVEPGALTQAVGSTALIVVGMGSIGYLMSKDVSRWMKPLSLIVFGLVIVSLVMVLAGSGGNPILSLAIGGVSALLILVDFNYLRKHGTERDTVWIATGIFVSIVNIFISLLNIFGDR